MRFELASFRLILRGLFPGPAPPARPAVLRGATAPAGAFRTGAGGSALAHSAGGGAGGGGGFGGGGGAGTLPPLPPPLALVGGGVPLARTVPVHLRDGQPARAAPRAGGPEGGGGGGGARGAHGQHGLTPLASAPSEAAPEARGLGLTPLEQHLAMFDHQSRALDAALSALF